VSGLVRACVIRVLGQELEGAGGMRVHAHGCSRADTGTGLVRKCAATVVVTGDGGPVSPQKGQGSGSKAIQAVREDR